VNKEKFEIGRNFATKIWNAARFLEMNSEVIPQDGLASIDAASLSADEKHILWACDLACRRMNDILTRYRIQDGALAVYDFFWTQICDWYVEYAKDAPNKATAFAILRDVYWKALRLLHPYMPFVTEEIAHQLGLLKEGETIMRTDYPKGYSEEEKSAWGLSQDVYDFVNAKREAITALRALRAEYKVPPSTFVKVTVATDDDRAAAEADSLKRAMRAESVDFAKAGSDLAMPSKMTAFGTVYLSLEGLIDKAAEAKRITAELAKLAGFIKSAEAKLANAQFTEHAPAAIVEEARRKLAENKEKVLQLEKLQKLFV
jgi:valyl-tRNA synthetase